MVIEGENKMGISITHSPTQTLVQTYLFNKFGIKNIPANSTYFVPDLIKAILEMLLENSQNTNCNLAGNDFHTKLSQKLNIDKTIGG